MKDKVVIITGGSSGIGKALAEVFGERGSKILITGRNKNNLDVAVADLRQKKINISGFQADVSHICGGSIAKWTESGIIAPWDTSKITAFAAER